MDRLQKQLLKSVKGEVRFDILSKKIYSVDASIFELEPVGIVLPKDQADLIATLQIASEHQIPVIARGAATGITGGCLGNGLIIDLSKYLNRILEINIEEEYAVCEPGVVQDRLNEALSSFGYRLGPDTSTGNRATIGGMLANNAAGARSLYYGRMVDCVESVELALAGGNLIHLRDLSTDEWEIKMKTSGQEGQIYREVLQIANEYGEEIKKRFPNIPRHVSGYNLDQLLKNPHFNLSKLIAGSEGTLGIATSIKVKIAKQLSHTALFVIHVNDMVEAMKRIPEILAFCPVSLEMIDHKILEMGKRSPTVKDKLSWLQGSPDAVFVAEFAAESNAELQEKILSFKAAVKDTSLGYAQTILTNPTLMSHVWQVRKAGLGLLLSKRTYNRAIAFIEDLSVSPTKLAPFMQEFTDYIKRIGKEAGIYGHIGSGCMHIRPYIDLRKQEDVDLMQKIMLDVSDMVLAYSGGLSGEHGDGLIRSWLNKKMFGEPLYHAFTKLKQAFDPNHLMNPGKIVEAPPILPTSLRLNPEIKQTPIPTFLDFSKEGGIELAADMCNGNGECRKAEKVMCPSFQATGDEFDTTRARAQTLRSIIHGRMPKEEFAGDGLYRVLDLCLECKGCKTECPSQVDMAKMKAEFLYQYQEKYGYSLRSRLFGHIHAINQMTYPIAPLFNLLKDSRLSQTMLSWLGITRKRALPKLAKERFSTWFQRQVQQENIKRVALFNDTYTEYNHPEIGKAAFKVLSSLGYQVLLISNRCCGRPLISKGLLKNARKKASSLIHALLPMATNHIPIILLEPSCLSAITDDYHGLIESSDGDLKSSLTTINSFCTSFDSFLSAHIQDKNLPLPFSKNPVKVLIHGHCHEKSLTGMASSLTVLSAIPGVTVEEIPSGCCGAAGSFGYETEHYELSMKIGNLRLLPSIRKAAPETIIVANGTSCRGQIHHGTKKEALHLAEFIANQLIPKT